MDRIRLKVLGLSYSRSQAGAYALILADEQDMHRIPIVIGMPEAQSIAIQLEKMQTQRPLTHDLIKKLADALQVTLKEAFIYRLDSGIFYSELLFEKDTQQSQNCRATLGQDNLFIGCHRTVGSSSNNKKHKNRNNFTIFRDKQSIQEEHPNQGIVYPLILK